MASCSLRTIIIETKQSTIWNAENALNAEKLESGPGDNRRKEESDLETLRVRRFGRELG